MPVADPRTAKGRATRERIVQAAVELVAAKGAVAVSLDDVCERSAASRSQLYHYFDDKADLIRAVVASTTETVLGAQAAHLERLDSWEAIDAWCDELVALQIARAARGGCPIGSLVGQLAERDERARAALETAFDRWEGHLADGLTRMRQRGQLRADVDPSRLATATMASLQGGLLLTQTRRDPTQLRVALDAARIVLRAAATDGGEGADERRSMLHQIARQAGG